MDSIVNNFWFGLGVPGFSEKFSPRMEIQGAREEEKSSLTTGSNLFILVYLGRSQPKDLWRWRIITPKFEGSFHPIPCGVVPTVFGFGNSFLFEFFGGSLLWLALLFSRLFFLFWCLGWFFVYIACIRWVHPFFLAYLNTSFCL